MNTGQAVVWPVGRGNTFKSSAFEVAATLNTNSSSASSEEQYVGLAGALICLEG